MHTNSLHTNQQLVNCNTHTHMHKFMQSQQKVIINMTFFII